MATYFIFLVAILQLAWVLTTLIQYRRQKAHQDSLVAAISGRPYWRIAVTRPDRLARIWKLRLVLSRAVLIDEGTSIRLRGRWHDTDRSFDVVIPKNDRHYPIWQSASPSMRTGNLAWAKFSTPMGDFMVAADTGLQTLSSRQALTDILRSVFPRIDLPSEARKDFALERNAWSLAAMILALALAGYAALDTYVFNQYELIDAQIYGLVSRPLFVAATALSVLGIGAAAFLTLRTGKVPAQESTALAILATLALALAAPPLLKRVDLAGQLPTDTQYVYRIVDRVVNLKPIDETLGLPPLRFSRAPEYWAQFSIGDEVAIPLVRGRLGLWQLDHARFDPPIFKFYDDQAKR